MDPKPSAVAVLAADSNSRTQLRLLSSPPMLMLADQWSELIRLHQPLGIHELRLWKKRRMLVGHYPLFYTSCSQNGLLAAVVHLVAYDHTLDNSIRSPLRLCASHVNAQKLTIAFPEPASVTFTPRSS